MPEEKTIDPREPDIDAIEEKRFENGQWAYSGNPETGHAKQFKDGKVMATKDFKKYKEVKTKYKTFEDLAGYEQKDFQIMTAQALNLAAQIADKPEGEIPAAKRYFKLLLELRNDKELKDLFIKKYNEI